MIRNGSTYRSGLPDREALAPPGSNDVWHVYDVDTGAWLGVVSCLRAQSLLVACKRAVDVYGLKVGSFRVELVRR